MIVFMRSDEFGYEEFDVTTIGEAVETIKRLRENVIKVNDGIRREIGVLVNEEGNIEEEDNTGGDAL